MAAYVDYNLRPNKAVERKLIFDTLARLSSVCHFPDYRYIGFGSFWFPDFLLAHRVLRIRDMLSMEYDENAKRADYNRPLKCIKVIPGDSSIVLNNGAVDCAEKKTVVWLDYDGVLDSSVVADLRTVCSSVRIGSFVIVTVNAVRRFYISDERSPDLEKSVRENLGILIPEKVPEDLDTRKGFRRFVASLILSHCEHVVTKASAGEKRFLPLFNFNYADGASMVTIGGAICDEALCAAIGKNGIFGETYVSGPDQFEIDLPVLTRRERITLNRLLPSHPELAAADAEESLSFPLPQNQCGAYSDFYRFYPNYAELFD